MSSLEGMRPGAFLDARTFGRDHSEYPFVKTPIAMSTHQRQQWYEHEVYRRPACPARPGLWRSGVAVTELGRPGAGRYTNGMTDDTGPKTAYEVAMERLRKKDAEAGIERQVVTADQKAAIAEIRNLYEGKLAQLEVVHEGQMRSLFDPAAREAVEGQYRRDRERLNSERDVKVAKARSEP